MLIQSLLAGVNRKPLNANVPDAGLAGEEVSGKSDGSSCLPATLPVKQSLSTTNTGDSLVIFSDTSWRESTHVDTAGANAANWLGVNAQLPPTSSYTMHVVPGNKVPAVDSAMVIYSGGGVHFFRKSFHLNVDTGVRARIRAYMDDGMEIYLNGYLLAREQDRDIKNAQAPYHDLLFKVNGSYENAYMGGDGFDQLRAHRLENLVHAGENELVIALQNQNIGDQGGFSLAIEILTGQPFVPELVSYVVSDNNWRMSNVITPTPNWVSSWPGVTTLPADQSFNLPVQLMPQNNAKGVFEVDSSWAIYSGGNIRYFRSSFIIVDSANINARFRTTFDEMIEVYLNNELLLRANTISVDHRKLPAHDVLFRDNYSPVNAFLGGDAYDYVAAVRMEDILRKGENTLTVVVRNRPKGEGGFSLRMDLDQGGGPVIVGLNEFPIVSRLQMDVYPNPTRGLVHIVPRGIAVQQGVKLEVFDLHGRLLKAQVYAGVVDGELLQLDLSDLASGVYSLRLQSGDHFVANRIVNY